MVKQSFRRLLAVLFFILLISGVNGQEQPSTGVIKVLKCENFEITGNGSSANWEDVEWIPITQWTKTSRNYLTKAKALYSETGMYFLFDCVDDLLNSDFHADNLELYLGDVVEVFLWPNLKAPVYFEYEVSPLNYELPLMIPNLGGPVFGWIPWRYDGERKALHKTVIRGGEKENGAEIDGWMAEIFIPFELLKPLIQEPPVSGNKWRTNLYRLDYDEGQTLFSWQKTEKGYHEYEKFGILLFE